MPVPQRLGHEAAQRGDRLLDRRAGDEPLRDLGRQAPAQRVPEPLVRPVLDAVVAAALHVVAAQRGVAHRAQGEPLLAVGVDQLLVHGRRLGQDPEPAERIGALVGPGRRRGDHRAAHPVGAVAPGDVVAVDAVARAVLGEGDVGGRPRDVVGKDVLGAVDHGRPGVVEGGVQVLGDLGLAVDHDRLAGEALEVDPHVAAGEAEADPVVDGALAVHALADARGPQRLDGAPLEHPGADAGQDVPPGLPLEDHRVDAGQLQQPGQQQPGRAAADDDDRHAGGHRRGRGHRACRRRSRTCMVGRQRATLDSGSRPSRTASTNSRSWFSKPLADRPAPDTSTGLPFPSARSS